MAAIYSLHADRAPVVQARRHGPVPKAIPSLERIRRQRIEQEVDAEIARKRVESLRETLQSLQAERLRALVDIAQPDHVLAARVRQRAAESLEDCNAQIAGFERRLREAGAAIPR